MNRLFGIILSLCNARNGVLLVDEIENGLHYSVQPDIWRTIFRLARDLNVQVFATSHSWDCVRAFQEAATESPEDGVLVRLSRKEGMIIPTLFSEQELEIVTRDQVEVRQIMAGKRVLMVEGQDDEHVVKHVCGQRNLGTIEHIRQYGGKDPLIEGIGVRLKESDIDALGIILDADTDLHARWQAVTSCLNAAGYSTVPAAPAPEGTAIEAPTDSLLPRVGVWLMPDNRVPGILEDFLRFLVPQGDALLTHVDRSIDSIPAGHCRFTDTK